jgi:hypothetical protein
MRLGGRNRKRIAFPYDRSTWSPPPAKPLSDCRSGGFVPMSGVEGRSSGASAAAHGQVAHLVQEHGALQRIYL